MPSNTIPGKSPGGLDRWKVDKALVYTATGCQGLQILLWLPKYTQTRTWHCDISQKNFYPIIFPLACCQVRWNHGWGQQNWRGRLLFTISDGPQSVAIANEISRLQCQDQLASLMLNCDWITTFRGLEDLTSFWDLFATMTMSRWWKREKLNCRLICNLECEERGTLLFGCFAVAYSQKQMQRICFFSNS